MTKQDRQVLADLSLAVRERLNRAEQAEALRLSLELHPLEPLPEVEPAGVAPGAVGSKIVVIDLS